MSNMMPAIMKDFRVYLNGNDTGANVSEIVLPKLTEKIESIKMGYFTVPTKMGLEAMETEITMYQHDFDTFIQLGLVNNTTGQIITFRGYQDNGQGRLDSVIVAMRGVFKELDLGSIKKGDMSTHKLSATLNHFSFTLNNKALIVVEPLTNTYILGDVDQLKLVNKALGI